MSNANAVLSLSSTSKGLDSTQRLARASALDREIRGLHRRRNGDLARLTERLAQLRESLGYLSLGFASVQDYAKARLGWGAGKVKALLELHGRLPRQPLLAEAFGAGEVDWSKAVLASRAVSREPEREADWLKAAQTLSSRELEARVCGETGEKPRRGRWLELSVEDEISLEEGLRALRTEGLELAPGAAVAELIRRALGGGSTGSTSYRFLLSECVSCKRTTHPAGRGDAFLDPALASRLRCDAEIQDTRQRPSRVSSTIPPSVKNQIQARSKGCCEFPGCTHRGYLEFHHGLGRGRGHDPDFMYHFCAGHHRAPHEGAVRIQGSWSTGVRFLRADGSLIGTAGGERGSPLPDAVSSERPMEDAFAKPGDEEVDPLAAEPKASRESSAAEPKASRESSAAEPKASRESSEAGRLAVKGLVDPLRSQTLALKALRRLELPARRAKSLLHSVLSERPALRTAEPGELVRAVLLRL